jgi:hypothetical protein
MSLERRLSRLEEAQALAEAQRIRQMYATTAAEHGLTVEEFMEEAECFLSQSLEDQLAEIDRIAAALEAEGMTWDDVADIKATLTREYRPL